MLSIEFSAIAPRCSEMLFATNSFKSRTCFLQAQQRPHELDNVAETREKIKEVARCTRKRQCLDNYLEDASLQVVTLLLVPTGFPFARAAAAATDSLHCLSCDRVRTGECFHLRSRGLFSVDFFHLLLSVRRIEWCSPLSLTPAGSETLRSSQRTPQRATNGLPQLSCR